MSTLAKPKRRARREAPLLERPFVPPGRTTWVVAALGSAFLLSGSAALIHELVWARLLGHLFGATSLAISTVLAAFMAGLAIGSYWIGRRCDRLGDLRRVYAWLEIAIGIFALLVPLALDLVEPLYAWIWRRFQFSFAVFSVLRFVVAASILLLPSIMMGATLPVLADYFARLEGRRLAPQWLYTVNLAGAALGVAVGGFVLMPAIGTWGTILVGAALNIGVGVTVAFLPALPEREREAAASAVESAPDRLLLATAFLSGAMSLAMQVAWTRVLTLIVGSTTYAFSSVLFVNLVALGVGSAWASRRGARVTHVGPDLAVMHGLLAVTLLGTLYAVNRLPYWYLGLYGWWEPASLPGLVALGAAVVFGVLFWPVASAGTILPLALVGALPSAGRRTGAAVGRVYAINTLGAIAGAMASGFLLVPVLGSQWTLLGVSAAAALMGLVLASRRPRPRWLPGVALATLAVVALGAAMRPEWNYLELHAGVSEPGRLTSTRNLTAEGERTLYQREGRTASVLVAERRGGRRLLQINARTNASDLPQDVATQVLLAQLPLLVAPRVDEVFLVGWGSGMTAGSVTQSPAKRVTAVELEPAVVEASRFFEHVNHAPLQNARVRLFEDDARHILLASEDRYDVIISEPPHPWVTGVANLFTRDFYELCAERLHPEGVVAQWLQAYQISFETFRAIVASFQSIFPEVLMFQGGGSDTILLGSRRPLRLDLTGLERRWQQPMVLAELSRIGMSRPEHLLATLWLGPDAVRAMVRDALLNTDDNMLVEFRGPRDAVRRGVESVRATMAGLEPYFTPVEAMLVDPSALLGSRERLRGLIEGLRARGRDAARYEELLARLG